MATYDGLLFFRKREVREEKKRPKSLVRWGSLGQNTSLDSATGFGFWEVFWPFWQVFCSYEPRYIQATLLLSNHFKKMCY